MTKIITFAGLSLPATPDSTWEPLLEQVQIRSPAQDGDIFTAARDKPQTRGEMSNCAENYALGLNDFLPKP